MKVNWLSLYFILLGVFCLVMALYCYYDGQLFVCIMDFVIGLFDLIYGKLLEVNY